MILTFIYLAVMLVSFLIATFLIASLLGLIREGKLASLTYAGACEMKAKENS